MELRTGVENEAAGLAAERAQADHVEAMAAALDAMDRAIARDELGVIEDFAFHRAIAEATGNPQFPRFLEFLGRYIIPRQSVRAEAPGVRSYLVTIQAEHRTILEAIRARSVGHARRAMRRHLLRSRQRYRRLAASAAKGGVGSCHSFAPFEGGLVQGEEADDATLTYRSPDRPSWRHRP